MDRFTTKFCGWGTLTQEMAENWYKTDSNLEQSGHDLLDTVLADCKSKVPTKAKTKDCFERIIECKLKILLIIFASLIFKLFTVDSNCQKPR